MSRTKPRVGGTTNPVKKIISFKPNSGVFNIYDKATKSKSEVESLSLIILDADRFSISGYSPEFDAGFVCNLVFNTRKEPLTVGVIQNGKYKKVAEGLYQDIKEDLEGANYTKNVLALVDDGDGNFELADLQLVGQARSIFGDWFNENESEAYDSVVTLTASKEVFNYNKKSGELEVVPKDKQKRWRTTWLRKLEMSMETADEAQIDLAVEEDSKLQAYFKSLAGEEVAGAPEASDIPTAPADVEEGDKDDLPF